MSRLQAKLGKTIQHLRRDKGYSQEAFAAHVGVHRTYMGAVERGEKNVSLQNIERIAKALGIRTSDLLREAEDG